MVKLTMEGATIEGTPEEVVEMLELMGKKLGEPAAIPMTPKEAAFWFREGFEYTLKNGEEVYAYEVSLGGRLAKVAKKGEGRTFYQIIDVNDIIR